VDNLLRFAVALLLLLLHACLTPDPLSLAAQAPPWRVVVAPAAEPGDPLVVSGTVVASDGVTPLPGATVQVHQTDAAGYYTARGEPGSEPRLRGTMRTDAEGRYEFRTIRPGPYPGGGIPAHIHFVVAHPGSRERRFEIVFEGDRYLTERIRADARSPRGGHALCAPTQDADGVLRCRQDIRMEPLG